MKAIIPVAGAGTKLRPITYTQPKPLIPVAGKRIISYIIDELVEMGVTDFYFIIGHLGEKVRNFLESEYPKLSMVFINQQDRLGLGHAIFMANPYFEYDDDVVIWLGDTILEFPISSFKNSLTSVIGVKRVNNPQEFGVVEKDLQSGFINKVVEKPKIPKSNLAMVGIYRFKKIGQLMEVLEYNIKHKIQTHNEYQLTDGIMGIIEKGVRIQCLPVDNWFDCGKKDILLLTNAKKLDDIVYSPENMPHFEDSIIINPVAIGKNCDIKNSIIGPHVTIGNNVKINHSIIEDSIIGNFASIEDIVLKHSIVGSDALIKGMKKSLNIGDNTEIDFSS